MEGDYPAKYVGIRDVAVCLQVFKSKKGNDVCCVLERQNIQFINLLNLLSFIHLRRDYKQK